eukprot:gnl/Trimastix_PCT/3494.p1 GENE.gnl/Trimastix_PCT/3494~~gnl/Trimastix_PCT/3494.p1  ORF type:complete len:191 (+),score=23.24 gnl/Trimastix_PCT/3494:77-649(+)
MSVSPSQDISPSPSLYRLGSKNPVKLSALQEVLDELSILSQVEGHNVSSEVPDQPIGFEQTMQGARTRARNAYHLGNVHFGVGLESGLVPVPLTRTGYLNVTCCALFDGTTYHIGMGPGFELPSSVARGVFEQGLVLEQAVHAAGWVPPNENPKVGSRQGMIGLLTENVVTRKRYTKPAIFMAFAAMKGA